MRILQIVLILILFSCGKPQELKTLNWNDNQISWTVLDGGATTSYYWQIFYKSQDENKNKLIFESYSSPYLTDISIQNNNLVIHALDDHNQPEFINIDLTKIEDYIKEPVKYERTILKQTNDSYKEPEFIKLEREFAIKHNLTN